MICIVDYDISNNEVKYEINYIDGYSEENENEFEVILTGMISIVCLSTENDTIK